jgi:methylated-DNA-protein-cysteine methyltransferase-like protein
MYQPPDPATFNALVWAIVQQIPAGRVSTYGQIASMIPPPEGVDALRYRRLGARWVGSAMRATPSDSGVPWQRVINSQGMISLPKGSAGADEQRLRLELEGVTFDERGRVDFAIVGWQGPSPDWLAAHGLLPPRPLRKQKTASDAAQPGLL